VSNIWQTKTPEKKFFSFKIKNLNKKKIIFAKNASIKLELKIEKLNKKKFFKNT
jgi:hypothetical protein